jgi:PEP-CTERM motif
MKLLRHSVAALLSGLAVMLGSAPAAAMPIDKQLVVTVRTVCDNAGLNCASQGPLGNLFYEAEGDKIWAQAGIDLLFVLGPNINNSALLNGQGSLGAFTAPLGGTGTTMFLTNSLSSAGLFGFAYGGSGGLAINMSAVNSFNGGIGRLDTIAHELGHNLGLYFGPGASGGHDNSNPNFLMASGGIRNVPTSLAQICPDPTLATCRSLLSDAHIATARASSLLTPIPEPGTWALMALGGLLVGAAARRQRA